MFCWNKVFVKKGRESDASDQQVFKSHGGKSRRALDGFRLAWALCCFLPSVR